MGAATAIRLSAAAEPAPSPGAEAERRLREIAELSSDWFWETDTEHRFVYLSEVSDSVVRQHKDQALGRRRVDMVDPSLTDAGALARHLDDLDHQRAFRDFVYASTHLGRLRYLKICGRPRFDGAGRFLGYIGTTTDVTARVEAEARRDSAEQRREQLRGVMAQAQKLEAISRLAGGLAHDLNNTLLPVVMLTELVMDDLPEGSPARDDLERVIAAAEHARNLVQRLVTFSRLGRSAGGSASIDPSVSEAVDLVRAAVGPDLAVRLDLRAPDIGVPIDAAAIRQIVTNLGLNAAQAIGDRAGMVTIETAPVEADDERLRDHPGRHAGRRYVRLSVVDDGPGIPPEILPHIFDPFFTTKPVGQGTGLGLAVVHGLVTQAGGSIAIDGNDGTRFDILLPILGETPE